MFIAIEVSTDYVMLILFSLLLLGETKKWSKIILDGFIVTWNDFTLKLLIYFFPSCKTLRLHNEILSFKHKQDENLYHA